MVRLNSRLRWLFTVALLCCIAQTIFAYSVLRKARKEAERSQEIFDRVTSIVTGLEDTISSLSSVPSSQETSYSSSDEYSPRPLPPRLEGSGKVGSFLYSDWRFPDGERRRYYLRRDSPPQQVAAFLRNISYDALDHQYVTGDYP